MGDSLVQASTLAITTVFVVLATVAVTLRIWARSIKLLLLGADDYIVMVALLFCWGLLLITAVAGGLGGINDSKLDLISTNILFSKIFWVEPFLVTPALVTVKVSVLLFYRRIFIIRPFKLACNVMIALIATWGISNIIVQLTMASPLYRAWDPSAKYIRIDYDTFALAQAGASICLDFITLCLPLPVIGRLKMKTRQKLLTIGIFWLGLFCVVAGAVRFYWGYKEIANALASTGGNTYASASQVYLWDRIEPCASVIAACLPTYGPLIRGNHKLESFSQRAQSLFSLRLRSRNSSLRRSSVRIGSSGSSLPRSGAIGSPFLATTQKSAAMLGLKPTPRFEERSGTRVESGETREIGLDGIHITPRFDLEYEDV